MPKPPDARAADRRSSLVRRAIAPRLIETLRGSRAVALVGPRQAGKTTLVRDLIRTEYPARYVTMDDPTVLAGARLDPTTFIADLLEPTIIDEVQRAPDLLLAIKERLDRDQRNGQFLLTGSANIQTLPTIRDALPGRVEYARLWPLAQSEIERGDVNLVDALFVPQLPAEGGWIDRREIARRIAAGGFPSAFSRSYRSRASFFEGYVDSVVGRDVPEIARTRDAANVGRLLRLMAARSASLLSREGLARDIGLDRKTIDHHLRILEDLMLVRLHPAWHTSLSSREVKTPKVFLTDTGMLNALIGASPERILGDQSVTGMAFETFAVMELVKQASWGDTLARLFHYRDHDGREVDAILEGPDGSIVGVEVKSSATASSSDFRSLRFLRDKLGARFRCGVLLYCGAQRVPFGERLYALPLSCLWS